MAGRPGFLGGLHRTDATEIRRAIGSGPAALTGLAVASDGDPSPRRNGDGVGAPGELDPIWGTPGVSIPQGSEIPPAGEEPSEGIVVDVELLGVGFHLGGQMHTGRFDRLSGWINMQSGFVRVRDALPVQLDSAADIDPEPPPRTLWVRLSQVVVVAADTASRRHSRG